jgi:hypothetical protein
MCKVKYILLHICKYILIQLHLLFFRLCLLSRSCDMFEYASSSCSFYPNHQMKTINIHRLVKIDTSNAKNIYVLHCSTPQENWLLNSDAATHSRERNYYRSFM